MKKLVTVALGLLLSQGAQAQEAPAQVKLLGKSPDGRFMLAESSRRLNGELTLYTVSRSDFSTSPDRIGSRCISIVKAALKAPSTAKFQYPMYVIKHPNGASVSGYVDAQNSYGAMLRNSFYCNFVVYRDRVGVYYDLY